VTAPPSALQEAVPETRRDGPLVVDDPADPVRVVVSVSPSDGQDSRSVLRAGESLTVEPRSGSTIQVSALRPRSRP
jgi:hypothetical protein